MTYGYARVSNHDQNIARQIAALQEFPVPAGNIFVDRQSGKSFQRPAYQKLLRRLKKDDLLCVKSIDRLGRNYQEIMEHWQLITKTKQVHIVVLDMPLLDTRTGKDLMGTFISDIVLQILSFVAENERMNIRQRQREGIAAAKKRGVRFGRPSIETSQEFFYLMELYEAGCISRREICKRFCMSESTFYRRLRQHRTPDNK